MKIVSGLCRATSVRCHCIDMMVYGKISSVQYDAIAPTPHNQPSFPIFYSSDLSESFQRVDTG